MYPTIYYKRVYNSVYANSNIPDPLHLLFTHIHPAVGRKWPHNFAGNYHSLQLKLAKGECH